MPWYVALLLPAIEKIGFKLLEQGLKCLEHKYPGLTPLVSSMITWLDAQNTVGNQNAVSQLSNHVQSIGIIRSPGILSGD